MLSAFDYFIALALYKLFIIIITIITISYQTGVK